MICVDLFSGGGGFSIGFKKAGFMVYGYEIDDKIVATAIQNGLNTCKCNILKDDFLTYLPPHVDVLIGGPPCQPFSQANMHAQGEDDTRNGVTRFLDVVKVKQPPVFIMEESPRLLTKYKSYFDSILKRAESYGYICHYKQVNMDKFLVPQSRRRLILVGSKCPCNFLENVTEKPMNIESVITINEIESVERTATATKQNFTNSVSIILPETLKRIHNYETKCSGLKHTRILNTMKPSRTLTVVGLKAPTQKAVPNCVLRFGFSNNKLVNKATVDEGVQLEQRPLSITEMKRLQTFPDTYHFPDRKTAEKIIGNSVPPAFAYIIANRVKSYISGLV